MNKKVILCVMMVLNVVLGIVFFGKLVDASRELTWAYFEQGEIRPSTILSNLDQERYGDVAVLARSGRVGGEVKDEHRDLYLLGEYADLLFLEKTFAAKGDDEAAKRCADRRAEIRSEIAEYGVVLDKMDDSIVNAVRER